MTHHLQTPDEWLLEQYDQGLAKPQNHVRDLLELVHDAPPGSTEDHPRWSGDATWPDPKAYADLDRRDAQAARLAQLATIPPSRRTA